VFTNTLDRPISQGKLPLLHTAMRPRPLGVCREEVVEVPVVPDRCVGQMHVGRTLSLTASGLWRMRTTSVVHDGAHARPIHPRRNTLHPSIVSSH
jgi:hypothetical protein